MMAMTIPVSYTSDYIQAACDLVPMGNRMLCCGVGWILVTISYLCLGRRTVLDRLILQLTQDKPVHITLKPKQVQSGYG